VAEAKNTPAPISAAAASAADFVYHESYVAPRFVEFSSYWYDISGGVSDGQDGMVQASAKNALWDGAALFLLTRRVIYQMPASKTALHSLLDEVVEDRALLRELDSLLLQNPGTHDEIVAFAEACLSFVDHRLGLKRWRDFYGSLSTPQLYGRYHQRLLDLGRLAEELNLALPRSVDAISEGIRIRGEVQRLVSELSAS
jgi:hypothetical protein